MIRKAAGIAAILVVIFVIAIIAKANPVYPQPARPDQQPLRVFNPEPDQPFDMPAGNPATTAFLQPLPEQLVPFSSPTFAVFPSFVVMNDPTPEAPRSPEFLAFFRPFREPAFGPAQQPFFGTDRQPV